MLSEKRDNKIPEFVHLTLYRAGTSLVSHNFYNEQNDLQANSTFTLEASTLVLSPECELEIQSFGDRNE